MIKKVLNEIRTFYIKYYDRLPIEGKEVIKAFLDADTHTPEEAISLLKKANNWQVRYWENEIEQGRLKADRPNPRTVKKNLKIYDIKEERIKAEVRRRPDYRSQRSI